MRSIYCSADPIQNDKHTRRIKVIWRLKNWTSLVAVFLKLGNHVDTLVMLVIKSHFMFSLHCQINNVIESNHL